MPDTTDRCSDCPLQQDRRAFLAALVAVGFSLRRGTAPQLGYATGSRSGLGPVRYPIPPQDGATIDKQNQVILVRFQGMAYAFALSCPHQNTALRWKQEDLKFQCPKHKSQYQPDGTFIKGRATRNMDRMPIKREGSTLVVDVDHVFESDKDAAGWAGARVSLA